MEFEYPAEAEAFRSELRQFLKEELPPWWTNTWVDDDRIIPLTLEFARSWPKEAG